MQTSRSGSQSHLPRSSSADKLNRGAGETPRSGGGGGLLEALGVGFGFGGQAVTEQCRLDRVLCAFGLGNRVVHTVCAHDASYTYHELVTVLDVTNKETRYDCRLRHREYLPDMLPDEF